MDNTGNTHERHLACNGRGGAPVCEHAEDVLAFLDLHDLVELRGRMGDGPWREVSDVAQVVANYARCHPRVEAVRYPGLKGDPLFDEAAHTLVGGFGPRVAYLVGGTWHLLACGAGDARDAVMRLEHELAV